MPRHVLRREDRLLHFWLSLKATDSIPKGSAALPIEYGAGARCPQSTTTEVMYSSMMMRNE